MSKIPVGVLGATGTVGSVSCNCWPSTLVRSGGGHRLRPHDRPPLWRRVNWMMPGDVPQRTAELIVQPTSLELDLPGDPPVVSRLCPRPRPKSGNRASPLRAMP